MEVFFHQPFEYPGPFHSTSKWSRNKRSSRFKIKLKQAYVPDFEQHERFELWITRTQRRIVYVLDVIRFTKILTSM